MRISVIGAGSWGTTIGAMVADSVPTVVWARREELARSISTDHENPDYLPDVRLPSALSATSDLDDAVARAELLVMAVPSHGFREVLSKAAGSVPPESSQSKFPSRS